MNAAIEPGAITLNREDMAELAVALWRIERRARREERTPESVRIACEMARDRLGALGFTLREMVGEAYHENLRVRVVEWDRSEGAPRIAGCLSPAVYFRNELIRPAEITVEGEAHAATDR